MTVGARWTETALPAEVSQAAYFWRTLAGERRNVTADLAVARESLHALKDGQQVLGLRAMARARCRVRELQHQLFELDGLIAALDSRFALQESAER
jgi:hypothetical protein